MRVIDSEAFRGCTSLTNVIIPAGVKSIEMDSFDGCIRLTTVYYTGTEEQWNAISVEDGNAPLTNAAIVYNYNP
ncbi:MAG: leucine-rich repeat protein [Clostridia bacterium]|nr:leucine-rich repeat protein [Clostridia bacterium]